MKASLTRREQHLADNQVLLLRVKRVLLVEFIAWDGEGKPS